MKELQRLVRLIDKLGPASNPLLNLQDEATLESKLFHFLKLSNVYTDEDVAKELYGNTKLTSGFRMLKSRFRNKLYNHLHFLEYSTDKLNSANESTYVCLSLLTEAQALITNSELKLALKLYNQVLKIAIDCDINEMKISAIEGMRGVYQNLARYKEFNEREAELLKFYDVQLQERKARLLYDHTMMIIRGPVSQKYEILKVFPSKLNELWNLWETSRSSKIFFLRHVVQIAFLEQLGEYSKIVDAIAHAESLVVTNKVNTSWYNRKFNAYIEIYALLQSRQYEKGIDLAAKSINMFPPYTFNWYGFMENYVLLTLHSKHYKQTEVLLNKVSENGHLSKLADSSKERWELYRRYFLFIIEHADTGEVNPLLPEIVIDLTILPKDKSGFNLALLVLDVLEKLADGEADELEAQAERVRKYSQKYLKGEKAERPRLFMRLLLLALTKQNAAGAREQGQQLLERLQAAPLPGDAFTEVEIVPYEHLWELALELLGKHK